MHDYMNYVITSAHTLTHRENECIRRGDSFFMYNIYV